MARLRCAVLDDYQGVALDSADWTALDDRVDVRVIREHLPTEDEIAGALADCEIVVAMRERTPFSASLFARLPRLRLLVTTGMRNASIDLEAAAAQGVTVCGTSSDHRSTVELTWALILGVARRIVEENRALREGGPWQSTLGADLAGRRLGLLGLGRIGTAVARVGLAFGMEVTAWSRNLTDERAREAGAVRAASLEELLETSDVVSVHLVLSDRTRGLLGASELRRMRETACLVNTSRGPIVDQDALVRALREGWIAGAACDVYDTEPLPAGHPLRSAPNLLATPHLGYVTRGTYARFYGEAVEDIAAWLDGSPLRVLG